MIKLFIGKAFSKTGCCEISCKDITESISCDFVHYGKDLFVCESFSDEFFLDCFKCLSEFLLLIFEKIGFFHCLSPFIWLMAIETIPLTKERMKYRNPFMIR